ncbi:TPR repeats containing protein [Oceanimonas sp. GK1]|uniref:tetratricopeptide repeat protein n=1 Tax=Oceanimonas sp. (strain GK1 / IBRC-M 10197) TaxID=511062 RepID=UPI0002494B42|nr:tetratricopeptide repeat protein [Oceanimonas sp. GK1]AEY00327.1 TPR repeats containing protein [Oceanimonas sp. GK1]
MNKAMLLIALFTLPAAHAADRLEPIQHRWAECQYRVADAERESCLKALSIQADLASSANPERTDLLIWSAIVKSTWAGAKGGLGALPLVKDARSRLEKALTMDEGALDGSAYTSLGSLYYQVPGWPVGFGDDDKAGELLRKALAINPDGIDPNFFYGDFLLDQGNKAEARRYLEKALQAPARPGRELADAGRRKEIEARLGRL